MGELRPGRAARAGAKAVHPARAESDALLSSLQAFALAVGGAHPPLARSVLPPPLEMLFSSEDLFTLE